MLTPWVPERNSGPGMAKAHSGLCRTTLSSKAHSGTWTPRPCSYQYGVQGWVQISIASQWGHPISSSQSDYSVSLFQTVGLLCGVAVSHTTCLHEFTYTGRRGGQKVTWCVWLCDSIYSVGVHPGGSDKYELWIWCCLRWYQFPWVSYILASHCV